MCIFYSYILSCNLWRQCTLQKIHISYSLFLTYHFSSKCYGGITVWKQNRENGSNVLRKTIANKISFVVKLHFCLLSGNFLKIPYKTIQKDFKKQIKSLSWLCERHYFFSGQKFNPPNLIWPYMKHFLSRLSNLYLLTLKKYLIFKMLNISKWKFTMICYML